MPYSSDTIYYVIDNLQDISEGIKQLVKVIQANNSHSSPKITSQNVYSNNSLDNFFKKAAGDFNEICNNSIEKIQTFIAEELESRSSSVNKKYIQSLNLSFLLMDSLIKQLKSFVEIYLQLSKFPRSEELNIFIEAIQDNIEKHETFKDILSIKIRKEVDNIK